MKTEFKTASLIQGLIEQVRKNYSDIYDQWCNVGRTLAGHRGDPKGHAFEHLDAHIDLVLRALEADQCKAYAASDDKFCGGVLFYQVSMSKLWLFSVYEIVRETCDVSCDPECRQKTGAIKITAFVAVRFCQ